MELIERYQEELNTLKVKMLKAQQFAKELPLFRDMIINSKITGEENHIGFGKRYKNMYYDWGINRVNYGSSHTARINNYSRGVDLGHDKYLFCLYFNTIALYNSHEEHGLADLNSDKVFFYDCLNNTFYIEDKYIEEFLESANEWYLKAKNQEKIRKKEVKIKEMEERLKELKGE